MRVGMLSVGVGLIVVGVVWIFQGVGLLGGSFMTGQAFWVWMGALALVIGVLILLRGLRRS
jgi:hypothetical protein